MLSNTATPVYYHQFRQRVISGEIPICEEISLEMNRIDMLILDPKYYYDRGPVEGFIKFCENELTQTDGSDIHMLDSFKLWAEQIFGWYYYVDKRIFVPGLNGKRGKYEIVRVKKRLVSKQYLIVARGAAKTMYQSFIQSYFLNVDTTSTHQVTTAPTMRQAEEVLSPIRTSIIRSKGPLFKFLTEGSLRNTTGSQMDRPKLLSTKKGIEQNLTGSILEIRPMSIDKLQGLRPAVSTVDEWLSGDIREDVVGALEQGASKLENYLIIAVSSEGTVRNGSGDAIKMELTKILRGEYVNPHVSIFWYKLDNLAEIANPNMWIKANPNLGVTVQYEAYQRDVERAESAPSTRNDIIAKRFGIPMEGFTYFFTYEETLVHRKKKYTGLPCSLGADLSQGDDFCSFTFIFPNPRGGFGIKTLNFVSSFTVSKLSLSAKAKYDEFVKEGSLIIHDGTVLDMPKVYEDVVSFYEGNNYDVMCLGYDPYNSIEFVNLWIADNGGDRYVVKVHQGAKTESVPLGELKNYAEQRQLYFDQSIMEYAMGNTMVLEDTNGNRKLYKKRADAKIDPVSALLDAYVAYKIHQEEFE